MSGKIKNIDFYSPLYRRSTKRAYLTDDGSVHKIRYFEAGTDKIICDVFLTESLEPYIVRDYVNDDQQKLTLNHLTLFQATKEPLFFKTNSDFFTYWFNEIFEIGDVIICDARLLDRPLSSLSDNITKFYQVHASHLVDSTNLQSEIKKSFTFLLNSIISPRDKIIVLTNGQKENIIQKKPHLIDNLVVIPHASDSVTLTEEVSDKHIVIVSRLDENKQLDDAIHAFNLFRKVHPEYVLDIYGDGDYFQVLQKLISQLDLNTAVFLKGRTNSAGKVFQSAAFSLLTSRSEGFALTVLESISNGCPVITYNVNWGPTEILDEQSGRVVQFNTPSALCSEMIAEVENPKNREKVRQRAKFFSQDEFFRKWINVFELNK